MYLLIMTGKVVFGPLREPEADRGDLPVDLSWREIGVLAPLAALCIWIGVQPTVLIGAIEDAVADTLGAYPHLVEQLDAQQGVANAVAEEETNLHG
jgi:NADH:ubiquinone oxidoreductase subunit 4 (subunit M)